MFVIKKIISSFFLPVPLITLFILLGLILLIKYKQQKTGLGFIIGAAVFLNCLCYEPISSLLLAPLENTHPEFVNTDTTLSFIVVLGGGVIADTSLPLSSHLGPSSLCRLTEGINLANRFIHARLIVSGYGGLNPVSVAETYLKMACRLGIDSSRIIMLPEPWDTHQEAVTISALVKDTPFALVTSASHMPRAYKLFRKQGTNPIPAPTFYLSGRTAAMFLKPPSGGSLLKVEMALHEYLGLLWAVLRRQI